MLKLQHDVTVTALLVALGINSENVFHQHYGATVYIELYRFNNQSHVKVCHFCHLTEEPTIGNFENEK